MEYTTTTEIILRWFAAFGAICMIAFIVFGWFKHYNWEREARLKQRGKRTLQH